MFDEDAAWTAYRDFEPLTDEAVRMLMQRTPASRDRTLSAWYGTQGAVVARKEYERIAEELTAFDRSKAKKSRQHRAN